MSDDIDTKEIIKPISETDPRVLAAARALIANDPQLVASPPSNVGSPTKMDSARPLLLSAIRRGMGFKAACRLSKVSYQTFLNWRKRGRAELERLEMYPEGTSPAIRELVYVLFVRDLDEAMGEGEFVMADVIHQAAIGGSEIVETRTVQIIEDGHVVKEVTTTTTKVLHPDWKAAADVLGRRHEGWQRKQSTELTGPHGGPVQSIGMGVDVTQLSEEELDAFIKNIQATIGSGTLASSDAE